MKNFLQHSNFIFVAVIAAASVCAVITSFVLPSLAFIEAGLIILFFLWTVISERFYKKKSRREVLRLEYYALLNFSFGCLQRGHFQSSGKSSNATPSCSAGS